MTTELSRRSLLKDGALGATAAVLGWRPVPLQIAVTPADVAALPFPEIPAGYQIAKMRAFVQVSNEALEDVPWMMSYVEDSLRRALVSRDDVHLIEPYGPEKIDRAAAIDVWSLDKSTFRLTQEWLAQPVPG